MKILEHLWNIRLKYLLVVKKIAIRLSEKQEKGFDGGGMYIEI